MTKGSLTAFPFWQVRFSHCSMLWHHPACSSLTIHGRLDRRFLKAYPGYNNFIWCKHLIQKWSTETAACSHTPELSHLLSWMRQQIYILSSHANWSPGTGFKFLSFGSHRAWNDHQTSLFTNAALEWKLLEAAQKCHKLPSIQNGAVKTWWHSPVKHKFLFSVSGMNKCPASFFTTVYTLSLV